MQTSVGAGLVALLAAIAPATTGANDVAFGGAGASLVPLAEPRVRMVSEDIDLTRAAPEGYRVLGPGHWSIEERLVDGAPRVEFVLRRTHWSPETDLELYIGPGGPSALNSSLIEGCPAPGQLFTDVMEADAFDAAAAAARLGPLDDETLRGCRNAVYAHHGYPFADAAVERAFYGETGIRVVPHEADSWRPGVVFARNRDFSPYMLTPAEQAYVAAIRALEWLP